MFYSSILTRPAVFLFDWPTNTLRITGGKLKQSLYSYYSKTKTAISFAKGWTPTIKWISVNQSHQSKNLCTNKWSFIIQEKIRQFNVRRADLLSEDTGSIPVLILWAFLTGLLCLLRHLQVTTFALKFMCVPVDRWYIYFILNSFIYLIYSPANYRTDYWKMPVQFPSWLCDPFYLITRVR